MSYYEPVYHRATRRGQSPLAVREAKEILMNIENERTWVPVKPQDLSVVGHDVVANGKVVGKGTPRVITALKNYTGAPPHTGELFGDFDERRAQKAREERIVINQLLQAKEFRYDFMLRVDHSTGNVNGIVTERYQHLPFDRLLSGFPTDWVVPRMQVDAGFVDIHVCHPEQVEGASFGVRISSSDIGLMRAMMFMQILVLVCSNGMVSIRELEAIKRFHLEEFGAPNIELDWDLKVRAFMDSFSGNYEVTRDALRASANVLTTEAEAHTALYRLGVGPVRIKAALEYATVKYPKLTKFAVAQGLTYASQTKSLRSKDTVQVKQSLENDLIATQYLAAA